MDDRGSRSGGACAALPSGTILQAAMREHQAGRLEQAAALYGKILASDGTNVASLHLLGTVRQQQGDPAGAVELIGRASALQPRVPVIQAGLAEALLALGRHERAVEHARSALVLGADDPNIRWILGQALAGLGRHAEAATELRHAIVLRPEFAQAYNSLGNALRALGRLDEAREAYREAIRLAPGLAVAHANLGAVFLQEGRPREAHPPLECAVELEPGRRCSWEWLGEAYERLERFDLAIPCRLRALTLTTEDRTSALLALGRALRKDNRPEEAEVQLRAAVATAPESAAAWFNLGLLLEERGEFAEAEAGFRAAIGFDPTYDLARVRLASLRRNTLSDTDFEALTGRLDAVGTDDESRTRILFALGQVLDARGEYARAAGCLREANALNLALARGDQRFQPDGLERFVDGLIAAFTPAFFVRTAGAGLDSRQPVFIIGLPRSGTTLIEQILASHPSVRGAGELLLGRQTFESLPETLDLPATPTDCVSRLDSTMIRMLAGWYVNRLNDLTGQRAERVVDKLPENYHYLGLLVALFPKATVIHCRRDLRDVALSCWMNDFPTVRWANDPGHIAVRFRAYLRLMEHWRSVLPATLHEVDYEETVADLEGVARRLVAALGLDWDPACLEFHRTRRAIRTGSLHQVRQPLYQQSVGRWRHYEHELADLFAALPRPCEKMGPAQQPD